MDLCCTALIARSFFLKKSEVLFNTSLKLSLMVGKHQLIKLSLSGRETPTFTHLFYKIFYKKTIISKADCKI
ncbi:hypothetical protein PUV51_10270, partial [Lactobacillus helveticus DSM 20075 = CGMCC 1.1877]|nr:hypothetical protein [Lactobacillus helveticus DSM 20075 = CGMCC 1.1877]